MSTPLSLELIKFPKRVLQYLSFTGSTFKFGLKDLSLNQV